MNTGTDIKKNLIIDNVSFIGYLFIVRYQNKV
jgi:hypothetical protein